MKLKSYKEYLKMGKEKVEEMKAPVRAAQSKTQGELKMLEIDEKIMTLNTEIQDICSTYPLEFDDLCRKLDEKALLERRKKQLGTIIKELFESDDE